ncbi:LivF ABC-type branched-chain amino acid transport systems, ATPase component [Rhabdaerophilaceae bacterium]
MLRVQSLQAGYGAMPVLFGVDLAIAPGEVVTLLGRNGMGKTTTVRAIMGLIRPSGGQVILHGRDVKGMTPERIARLGLGLVPEGRHIFPTLTVRENLLATSANRLGHSNPWTMDRAFGLFPRLRERHGQFARTLSGGEQQMLAIGRALMTNPQLLILDEACEGLAPVIRYEIWDCMAALKGEGLSILVIDKNLSALRRLADRHVIIEKGRTIWQGSGPDLDQNSAFVQRAIGV